MATKKQLEEALNELLPLVNEIGNISDKYKNVLEKYTKKSGIVTEEDRNEAAIEMINKYSDL